MRVVIKAAQALRGLACRPLEDRARSACVIPPSRFLSSSTPRLALRVDARNDEGLPSNDLVKGEDKLAPRPEHEHAVISTFDLFSIGGGLQVPITQWSVAQITRL